jgi:Tfp pilus assembly protein PilN
MPVMNLLPGRTSRRAAITSSRTPILAGVAGLGLLVLLALPTIARHHHASDLNSQASTIEAQNNQLQAQNALLNTTSHAQQQVATLQAGLGTVLQTDVAWARMLNEIARTMPNDVWLTSFQGQVTATAAAPVIPSTPTTTPGGAPGSTTTSSSTPPSGSPITTTPGGTSTPGVAASPLSGTITFGAVGLDFPSVSDWLKRISQMASFQDLWVPQAQKNTLGNQTVVDFQSTAALTNSALSDRAKTYGVGGAAR